MVVAPTTMPKKIETMKSSRFRGVRATRETEKMQTGRKTRINDVYSARFPKSDFAEPLSHASHN